MKTPAAIRKHVIGLLVAVGLLVAFVAFWKPILEPYASVEGLELAKEQVRALGWLGPVLCMALYAVFTVCFVPCTPLTIVVALLYGPVLGSIYALIGAGTGISVAFLLARHGLKRFVRRHVEHLKWFISLNARLESEGWKIVVITRMFPINPYNLLNYAYGLTAIRFRTYVWASLLGMMLPIGLTMFGVAAAGSVASGEASWKTLAILTVVTLAFAVMAFLPKRAKKAVSCVPDLKNPD